MNRILSTLFSAGLVAVPFASANAAGTYVRADGAVFDSDVGAACGALHTDLLFDAGERSVDLYDESVLDYLASCMATGELSNARIAIVGFGDGNLTSMDDSDLARDRASSVVSYLSARGVDSRRLITWSYATGWPGDVELSADRVQFRIIQDDAALMPTGTGTF